MKILLECSFQSCHTERMKNKERDVLGEMILNYLRENYKEELDKMDAMYPSNEEGLIEWAGRCGREALNERFERIFEQYL